MSRSIKLILIGVMINLVSIYTISDWYYWPLSKRLHWFRKFSHWVRYHPYEYELEKERMMYVSIVKGELCDKCKKVGDELNPVLDLHVTSRRDKDTIFVHVKCLGKLLDKLKVGKAGSS